jgi:hypothetical protein
MGLDTKIYWVSRNVTVTRIRIPELAVSAENWVSGIGSRQNNWEEMARKKLGCAKKAS